jgi:hypothetical protein
MDHAPIPESWRVTNVLRTTIVLTADCTCGDPCCGWGIFAGTKDAFHTPADAADDRQETQL